MRIIDYDDQYAKLNQTVFFKGVWATLLSVAFVFFLRGITQGHIAGHIVRLIVWLTNMTIQDAEYTYWCYVGRNMDYILCIVIILCMFLLFGVLLRSYKQYFQQVIGGIEQITEACSEPIVLCPELKAVERKLNSVKRDLIAREMEARMAEQQKNELVVYLAHDIKTPLTSVIGYLNLLNDRQGLREEERIKYIQIALDKANRLESLVNEFFELTRYTLVSPPLEQQKVDLCYLFIQLIDELYPLFRAKGKTMENRIDENVVVLGDAEKLARAFNNILKNAIAYSDENSVISVSLLIEDGAAVVEVRNKGVLTVDQQGMVFDKFYRADFARRTDTGGAGLGLAISKEIIELHDGTVTVRCDGTYTTFSVSLPLFSE